MLRNEDHAVDLAVEQRLHLADLPLDELVGVAENDGAALADGHIVDAANELGDFRIADVRHQDAYGRAVPHPQRPGQGCRATAALLALLFDMQAGLSVHMAISCKGLGLWRDVLEVPTKLDEGASE